MLFDGHEKPSLIAVAATRTLETAAIDYRETYIERIIAIGPVGDVKETETHSPDLL